MKCKHCGAKLKKSDEICPNCSKFVSDKTSGVPVTQTEITPTEVEPVSPRFSESDTVFEYKEHIMMNLLIILGTGLFFGIMLILSAFNNRYFMSKDIFSVLFSVVVIGSSVFLGIATYRQEKVCFLAIDDKRAYGTIPHGIFDTTDFEVEISDIVCVEKEGFYGKYSSPKITIVTAENRIEIKSSSGKILTSFKNALQERMIENETRS